MAFIVHTTNHKMVTWYNVIIGLTNIFFKFELLREVAPFIKDLEFVLIPLVQIYSSDPIKKFMMSNNINQLSY